MINVPGSTLEEAQLPRGELLERLEQSFDPEISMSSSILEQTKVSILLSFSLLRAILAHRINRGTFRA